MMKQIGIPSRWWPAIVHNSFDCHWSTAFVTIKLEEPPVTLGRSALDSHIPLERYFDGCIRVQLVERAVLDRNKVKEFSMSTVQYITFKSTINNYWIRFSYDSKNHHGRGECYLPKPKPEADNTNQCLDNSCYRKMNPSIVLLCIPLSVSKEILMSLLRATILSEGMTSSLHVKELVSDHRSYTKSLSSCKI